MKEEHHGISLKFVLRWFKTNVKKKGLAGLVDFTISLISDYWFDLRYGTSTRGWIPPAQLRTTSANARHSIRYQATKSRPFRKLMNILEFSSDSVFVDVGCGKGKVLMIAGGYRFKRIVGIEFSADLCEIARKNVENYRSRGGRVTSVEIINCDIVDYKLTGEENVFYLYNPFTDVVLRKFLINLERSLGSHPRQARLIYHIPEHAALIEEHPIFEKRTPYFIGGTDFVVYESRGAHAQL